MTIKMFAESHNVAIQTVSIYIRRHPDLFGGLTNAGTEDKRSVELSDAAVKLLEQQYPLPMPVEVINRDPEDIKRIDELMDEIRRLQMQITRQQDRIEELSNDHIALESVRLQLEDRTARLQEEIARAKAERSRADEAIEHAHKADLAQMSAETERDKIAIDVKNAQEQLSEARKRAEQAEAEIDRLRHRSFFDRLFNR